MNARETKRLERVLARTTRTESGCIVWQGSKRGWGYASIWWEGRTRYGHHLMWELRNGPVPDGLQLDHLCRNPMCINPDHLEPVTPRENVMRSTGIPVKNAAKTVCVRGHPFDEGNTGWKGDGNRYCKACMNWLRREYRRNARQAHANFPGEDEEKNK